MSACRTDFPGAQFLYNIRRSPQLSETFAFDVAYDTTFEQLEDLRTRMIAFLKAERRDYLPSFDVNVVGTLQFAVPLLMYPYNDRRVPRPGKDVAHGGHHVQEHLAASRLEKCVTLLTIMW